MNFVTKKFLYLFSFVFLISGTVTFVGSLHAQEGLTRITTGSTIAVPLWQPIDEVAEAQDWLGESLQRWSTKDLARVGELNGVGIDVYRQKINNAGLADVNPNDSQNARQIASALGADLLLIGTYQIKQDQIQLSAAFYDTDEERTVAAHSEMGTIGRITVLQTTLMKELLRKAGISLGSAELDWLEREKKLQATSLDFERPQARPEVLERGERTRNVYEVVGLDEPPEEAQQNNLVVGVHWPGFSIGYQPDRNTTLEFRAEANSDITVLGGRFNYHFYRFGESNLYWGLQASHIDFVGEVSEGTGFLGGGFLGFEQFVSERFSVKADVGSYMVSLEDDETAVSVSGLGFSLVTGVALHFW